jgi:hypothetical protein
MKRYLWLLLFSGFLVGPLRPAMADNPVLVSLLSHVTAVSEFTTHGQTKMQFLDGIVQFGHYQNDYIFAVDAGVSNSLAPEANGRLAGTVGIHLHAISWINGVFNISPFLADTLKLLEANPRYSYDSDVHHGVLGFTFGAKIPF